MTRGGFFDLDKTRAEIEALTTQSQAADFWSDVQSAQKTSKRLGELSQQYESWKKLRDEVVGLKEMDALGEFDHDVATELERLTTQFTKMEFDVLLADEHDDKDAILSIHAGAGGTEAQDWAEMLLRMFFRYAEKKGWKVTLLDKHDGGEAGIKSATFAVSGRYAYGYLKAEAGVHRLVRISPFDANKLRHTSFALLEVLPDLGDVAETKIDPQDLRIDTYLAGGHGGQGVQTTYSAVRITHIPTNIVVTCQNERSQTQNKETAMRILQAKLEAIALKERDAEKKKLRGEHHSAEWGNQIRSYVLHPYQMVKDHRTKHETQDTQGVLDGDLDPFIEAYLRWGKGE
jgi:peptide chain release factor 2